MPQLLVRDHRFGFSPGDQTQQDVRWNLDDASKKEYDACGRHRHQHRQQAEQDFRLESTETAPHHSSNAPMPPPCYHRCRTGMPDAFVLPTRSLPSLSRGRVGSQWPEMAIESGTEGRVPMGTRPLRRLAFGQTALTVPLLDPANACVRARCPAAG